MKFIAFAIVAAGLSTPAAAQDLVFSQRATESCLGSGAEFRSCIGLAAEACVEDNGYATMVLSGCYARELDWWDARLNDSYAFAIRYAKQADIENAGFGPSQEEALREMQRAWITYRDAKCAYARSHWGGGTGAGPAGVECLLRETAEQTWYIESMVTPG
ncbi:MULTISPECIES: lysozyme inhibitor LprI family protein [unclassified Mameliella]|uniref:lysozyme inhibitor LprI family protein n=1 Tax=unclassified Mameliella TaxID=2630630 RepID=UPI00273FDED6|nr:MULTISPECIES: lysozyme inhibitor LprI family protein [unclassified Mameliella]